MRARNPSSAVLIAGFAQRRHGYDTCCHVRPHSPSFVANFGLICGFVVRDPTIRLLTGNGASRLGLNATELGRVGVEAHRARLALRNGSTWLSFDSTAVETHISMTFR